MFDEKLMRCRKLKGGNFYRFHVAGNPRKDEWQAGSSLAIMMMTNIHNSLRFHPFSQPAARKAFNFVSHIDSRTLL